MIVLFGTGTDGRVYMAVTQSMHSHYQEYCKTFSIFDMYKDGHFGGTLHKREFNPKRLKNLASMECGIPAQHMAALGFSIKKNGDIVYYDHNFSPAVGNGANEKSGRINGKTIISNINDKSECWIRHNSIQLPLVISTPMYQPVDVLFNKVEIMYDQLYLHNWLPDTYDIWSISKNNFMTILEIDKEAEPGKFEEAINEYWSVKTTSVSNFNEFTRLDTNELPVWNAKNFLIPEPTSFRVEV